eukprot:287685-Rhodomonas_salina.2
MASASKLARRGPLMWRRVPACTGQLRQYKLCDWELAPSWEFLLRRNLYPPRRTRYTVQNAQ